MIPVYIGTYTDGTSQGIYRLELDRATARLSTPVLVATAVNPSFLAWHPHRQILYTVSETETVGSGKTGALLAYRVDADGSLVLVNEESSGGAHPCFVSVHPAGAHAFVANYGTGSVAVFPIRADGGLCAASALVQHTGSSAHPTRQKGPHAHAVRTAPGDGFVIATDLGADKLFVYRFDAQRGTLTPNEPAAVLSAPADGTLPRIHPCPEAVRVPAPPRRMSARRPLRTLTTPMTPRIPNLQSVWAELIDPRACRSQRRGVSTAGRGRTPQSPGHSGP